MFSWDSRRIWSTIASRAREALLRRLCQVLRGRFGGRVVVVVVFTWVVWLMSTSSRWPRATEAGFAVTCCVAAVETEPRSAGVEN